MCQPKKCLKIVFIGFYSVKHLKLKVVFGLVKAYIYAQHTPTYAPTIAWFSKILVHPVQKSLLFFWCVIGHFCCNDPAPMCVA